MLTNSVSNSPAFKGLIVAPLTTEGSVAINTKNIKSATFDYLGDNVLVKVDNDCHRLKITPEQFIAAYKQAAPIEGAVVDAVKLDYIV